MNHSRSKKKSVKRGKRTSKVEVTNVSHHGFWLLLQEREMFLTFARCPWFREASIGELLRVELASPHHLYWPKLDIDLAVESIEHAERYPLVSKIGPTRAVGKAKQKVDR